MTETIPRALIRGRLVAGAGAVVAGSLLFWATGSGVGLSPDSLKYILVARSLREGRGFFFLGEPLTHYPPLYPALLAAVGATGPESLGSARLLHVALFALNAALVSLLADRLAGGARWAGPLSLVLFLTPPMLDLHAMAWSESPFLSAVLATGLLISIPGAGVWVLLGAAFCLAAALNLRYAGLAFVPPVLVTLLVFHEGSRRTRILRALSVGALALAPLALWLLRNVLTAGSATHRALAFHPPDGDRLTEAIGTLGRLFGLSGTPAWALVALLPLLALASWTSPSAADPLPGRARALLGLVGLSLGGYLLFLAVSLSLVDADTPLDVRLLAPAHVFAVVLLAGLPNSLRLRGKPRLAWGVLAALALLSLFRLGQSLREGTRLRRDGEGFATPAWTRSDILEGLRALPRTTRVFTNGPEIVAFFSGRDASSVPVRFDRVSLREDPRFPLGVDRLCLAMDGGAALAYLDGVTWRWEAPEARDLEAACGLVVARRFDDGALYASGRRSSQVP